MAGRNSVDADTGQVGPEIAELLDLPFLTGVRYLAIEGTRVDARCEHDDGWMQAEVELPAVLSCAERLCEPSKVDPEGRAAVPADRIRRLSAADLGPGPWGADASPTWVGPVKVMAVSRARVAHPGAPLADQVRGAVHVLRERGALRAEASDEQTAAVPAARSGGPAIAVVVGTGSRAHDARAARCGRPTRGGDRRPRRGDHARGPPGGGARELGRRRASCTSRTRTWKKTSRRQSSTGRRPRAPWAILVGSTAWGREVASRVAARLDAGLTGDAVDLEVSDGRLVAWKPAFGGQLVAAIGATSPVQMATVRAGMITALAPADDQ